MARPGVMIYFDSQPFDKLPDEQAGKLVKAVMQYAQHGVIPSFDDADTVLNILFSMMQPKIDADAERYEQKCQKATDAVNARWERARADSDSVPGNNTDVYERIQTNTNYTNYNPTTNPTTTTTQTNSNSKPKAKSRDENIGEYEGEKERYVNVFMQNYSWSRKMAEYFVDWVIHLGADVNIDKELSQILDNNGKLKFTEDYICSLIADAIETNKQELDTRPLKERLRAV